MKVRYLIFFVIAAFALFYPVETLPSGSPGRAGIYEPVNWSVRETPGCLYGYQCRYGTWVPQITVNTPVWVFGITNRDQCNGIINFRKCPDYPCQKSCSEYIPVSYMCEVIYVPFNGGEYLPEEVPLTYIPKGRYVVTSPSFSMHYNMRLWFFPDDGNGPEKMSVTLRTDKQHYSREDVSVQFVLQVRDEDTKEYLEVDSISGVITLPDGTQKTVTEDWSWNDEEDQYQYVWDFTNDAGECSIPKEGNYTADVYVKKKYYKDMRANSNFDVCYHVEIDLEFDKDIPEYSLGESVKMTVHAVNQNGEPVNADIESVLQLPDGLLVTDLEWIKTDPGTYVTSYKPEQEGRHYITVGVKKDIRCYLEEASGTFYVRSCEKALVSLDISDAILEEPVQFVLTVTDGEGNPLAGGEIESLLYLPDDSTVILSWTDRKDGTYTAEYTPSLLGFYSLCGYVIVTGETGCSRGFFDGYFDVERKKLPDLLIRNEDITVYPEPEIGKEVTISVTVWNIGEADAEEFLVYILVDTIVIFEKHVEGLAAGESYTFECKWTFENSGCYIISAVADPWGEIL